MSNLSSSSWDISSFNQSSENFGKVKGFIFSFLSLFYENFPVDYKRSFVFFIDKEYILTRNCFASKAYRIFSSCEPEINAKDVWILNRRSKCRQFKLSGFGSYYFWEKIDFVFLDFRVLVAFTDLFIREEVAPFDFIDKGPFLSLGFLDLLVLTPDFIDLEIADFFPLVLLLKTVPFSSSFSSSY